MPLVAARQEKKVNPSSIRMHEGLEGCVKPRRKIAIQRETVSPQRQTTPLSRRLYYVTRHRNGSNKGRSSKQSRENVNNTNRKMIPGE